MFERFRRTDDRTAGRSPDNGRTAVAERPATREDDRAYRDDTGATTTRDDTRRAYRDDTARGRTAAGAAGTTTAVTREHIADARARQRAEYGGMNWGAAFFGWLVAVGLGAILVGLVAGAGTAIGLTELSGSEARANADTIGLGGGIALLVVLMIAYYAGGYVAGRMSRFDGARQGAAMWIVGLLITIALGIIAAVLGDDYNVLSRLDLPRIPIGQETLTTSGIIATVAVLLGTLIAAIFGGKVGERYHRKIDRAGITA